MATKKKGVLTSSREWAKHLRRFKKGKFWKGERQEEKKMVGDERMDFLVNKFDDSEWTF